MNIFRLVADSSHLLAFIILLLKIWKTRSCAGLSGKSQILFALVYSTRYLDLFSHFISTYNSVMKVIFIGASYSILYLIYMKFKTTFERNRDTFRIELLIIPVLVLALVFNYDSNSLLEVSWTFSIYLESVAILPQFLVSATGKAETIPFYYLICLGSYRSFYILNWVYRYYTEGFYDVIVLTAGIVQTVLYCDFFFYLYITKADNIRPYLLFFQSKDTKDHIDAGFVDADSALKPVFPLKESIDFVLIMPAEPKFGGQKFMEDRIVKVHHLKSTHPNLDKVDSGVGPNAIDKCCEVDANLIVSGTPITASSDPKQDISCLNRPD